MVIFECKTEVTQHTIVLHSNILSIIVIIECKNAVSMILVNNYYFNILLCFISLSTVPLHCKLLIL